MKELDLLQQPRRRRYITMYQVNEIMELWLEGDLGTNQIAKILGLRTEEVCRVIENDFRSGVKIAKRSWLGSQKHAKFDKRDSAQQ